MTSDKIKEVMDACYLAKRVRDMLPALPGGVTSSHIHYLDKIQQLQSMKDKVRVSDISDMLGLPRPSVTKTIKDMENLGFVKKLTTKEDGRVVYIQITDAGKALIDKYVDEYFTSLSKELTDITDEEANVMIEVVEKFYAVMSERNV
ncbi:MarR family winged helix-turn-helix transcriptional regulator [Holdemanella sp.]|jgi:DNA-binding MarR family transcriptional regulator|uniref:MarR family winged helix-turn-helix transcriptional regulator n=1 Tax=Holdemanella sp. TaxID=1971762 RepID=UPI003AF0CF4D